MTNRFRFLATTALAFLACFTVAQSQTTRTVLIEQFTGTWCQWCPYGADSIREILARVPNARVIAYHDNDPMATTEGDAIQDTLHCTAYPQAAIDRIVWQLPTTPPTYDIAISRAYWGAATSVRAQQSSPLAMSIRGTFDTTSRLLSGTVTMNILTPMTGSFNVHVVVSEDSLNYAQLKNVGGSVVTLNPYYHVHVVRKVLTGVNGVMLTTSGLSAPQQLVHNFNYIVPPTFDIRHVKVTAFVDQKFLIPYGSRNIQQAVQEPVWNNSNAFTFLPVNLVDFHADASRDGILLAWRTAGERNNRGWSIERATENQPWRSIAFVEGRANSEIAEAYTYLDDAVVAGTTYFYRLRQIDYDGTENLSSVVMAVFRAAPSNVLLHQNYPNPFNPSTEIAVDVARTMPLRLDVLDLMGRTIVTVADGVFEPGTHRFVWRGTDAGGTPLPAGMYTCRLTTPDGVQLRHMTLVK
ncbi:MAG: Omp28-related outer membrane protein [Bacteroidota bacterium]|nr:Omp28-related outer membrane protein [Bacteroidota bacterium]